MTRNWAKRHWVLFIVIVCLLILFIAGNSGLADGIRIIFVGILRLIGQIIQQLLGLIGQLVNKIGR